MKKWFLILISFFAVAAVVAQPLRYTAKVFGQVDTLKAVEYAVAPWLNKSIAFLSEYNVHEGEAATENRPLLMDIYQPFGDTLARRPAIVFVHGGAFLLGSRLNEDMVALCDSFARHGYVTASIDYRLGIGAAVTRIFGVILNVSVAKANVRRAVYRGVQDGRAAIRYLKQNAALYRIDTAKINVAGSSAGAFVALHNIYYNETGEIPPEIFTAPSLGGLDAIGASGFGGLADAVVSYWGAIENTAIIGNETRPVFLVHGEADKIVPFKNGVPLEASVPSNPLISISMPETMGSFCIDTALANRDIFHENYFAGGKGHEFYGCNTGDFPGEGPNQYWDTIIQKTSGFLFDRFKPTAGFDVSVLMLTAWFSVFASGGSSFEWDFGDGVKSSEPNPVHQFPDVGKYTVRLKTCHPNLACDTLSKTIEVGNIDFAGELVEGKITIYPNPVKDLIYIDGLERGSRVGIYDISGRVRLVSTLDEGKQIDVKHLNPGVYILELTTGRQKVVSKFIKIP